MKARRRRRGITLDPGGVGAACLGSSHCCEKDEDAVPGEDPALGTGRVAGLAGQLAHRIGELWPLAFPIALTPRARVEALRVVGLQRIRVRQDSFRLACVS